MSSERQTLKAACKTRNKSSNTSDESLIISSFALEFNSIEFKSLSFECQPINAADLQGDPRAQGNHPVLQSDHIAFFVTIAKFSK